MNAMSKKIIIHNYIIITLLTVGATAYRKSSFDPSIPSLSGYNLHLSSFNCSGTESRLISCGHTPRNAHHSNDAGIKCCEYYAVHSLGLGNSSSLLLERKLKF